MKKSLFFIVVFLLSVIYHITADGMAESFGIPEMGAGMFIKTFFAFLLFFFLLAVFVAVKTKKRKKCKMEDLDLSAIPPIKCFLPVLAESKSGRKMIRFFRRRVAHNY